VGLLLTSAVTFATYFQFEAFMLTKKVEKELHIEYMELADIFWGISFACYGLAHYLFAYNYYDCAVWLKNY
jgi:hypothetical protein